MFNFHSILVGFHIVGFKFAMKYLSRMDMPNAQQSHADQVMTFKLGIHESKNFRHNNDGGDMV